MLHTSNNILKRSFLNVVNSTSFFVQVLIGEMMRSTSSSRYFDSVLGLSLRTPGLESNVNVNARQSCRSRYGMMSLSTYNYCHESWVTN